MDSSNFWSFIGHIRPAANVLLAGTGIKPLTLAGWPPKELFTYNAIRVEHTSSNGSFQNICKDKICIPTCKIYILELEHSYLSHHKCREYSGNRVLYSTHILKHLQNADRQIIKKDNVELRFIDTPLAANVLVCSLKKFCSALLELCSGQK